jgi:hypothetical protein
LLLGIANRMSLLWFLMEDALTIKETKKWNVAKMIFHKLKTYPFDEETNMNLRLLGIEILTSGLIITNECADEEKTSIKVSPQYVDLRMDDARRRRDGIMSMTYLISCDIGYIANLRQFIEILYELFDEDSWNDWKRFHSHVTVATPNEKRIIEIDGIPVEELRTVSRQLKRHYDEQKRTIKTREDNAKQYEQLEAIKDRMAEIEYRQEAQSMLDEPVPFAHYDGMHWEWVDELWEEA